MKLKTLLGIITGFIAWWVLFYASLFVFGILWPALAEAGKAVFESNDPSQLTISMSILLLTMYFWINPIAAWITVRITKKPFHAWIMAAPIFLFACFQHFYTLWNILPNWYNLAVPILIPPLIFLGGKLVNVEK